MGNIKTIISNHNKAEINKSTHTDAVFEPAQLPQETICPSVVFAKSEIGNSRGQNIQFNSIQ